MNGRVYDPLLGMFLSPDNHVQMPDFTQNFNRYTYALNNPLIYTDPTGEFVDLALFLVCSAFLRGMFEADDGLIGNGDWNRKKFWSGAGKGLLQTGGMVLGAFTATGPLSLVANTISAMHGNVGFGPFNYDINEKDLSIGYGPFDYNISENEFDYIFEKGNTPKDNVMYGLRTISFLSSVKEQHGSLFATDEDKSFFGKAWQLTSRFTWEYVQTRVAMDIYNIYDNAGLIESTLIHKGVTEVSIKDYDAVSIGNKTFVGNKTDGIFIKSPFTGKFTITIPMHEFGHTIQSRILGPFYLPFIGLPSIGHAGAWNLFGQEWNYYDFYTESWANRLTIYY